MERIPQGPGYYSPSGYSTNPYQALIYLHNQVQQLTQANYLLTQQNAALQAETAHRTEDHGLADKQLEILSQIIAEKDNKLAETESKLLSVMLELAQANSKKEEVEVALKKANEIFHKPNTTAESSEPSAPPVNRRARKLNCRFYPSHLQKLLDAPNNSDTRPSTPRRTTQSVREQALHKTKK